MHTRTALAVLLAIVNVAASGAALPDDNLPLPLDNQSWGNGLTPEPNTGFDSPQYVRDTDPNPSVHRPVLEAFILSQPIGAADVGSEGLSAGAASTAYQIVALWGHWKDCNNDRYIGQYAAQRLTYSSDLLLDRDLCPPGGGNHNDWPWVRELKWFVPTGIAADGYLPEEARWTYDAKVWADFGAPGAPFNPDARFPVAAPEGTEAFVGGDPSRPDVVLHYHRGVVLETPAFPVDGIFSPDTVQPTRWDNLLDPQSGVGALLCDQGACTGWWSDVFIVANPTFDGTTENAPGLGAGPFDVVTVYAAFSSQAGTQLQTGTWCSYSRGQPSVGDGWNNANGLACDIDFARLLRS